MSRDEDAAGDPSAKQPESGGALRDLLLIGSGVLVGILIGIHLADPGDPRVSPGAGEEESEDVELEERVLEAFTNDPVLSGRAIEIGSLADGVITLAGSVYSAREVEYAATIAGGTPGVAGVVNRLHVRADEQAETRDPDETRNAEAPATE